MASQDRHQLVEGRPLRVFLIAGEHSGDALGGKLIEALRRLSRHPIELAGIGGELMEEQGCRSLFPLEELAVMSPLDVLPRLRSIYRRMRQAVDAVLIFQPNVLVILDSPEFTHQVARRVRHRNPQIPIVDYVSPSVWAWRPWRARSMLRYVDHVMAILPFEPEVYVRLGGPPCSYVGHPLIEKLDWIDALDAQGLRERLGIALDSKVLVVLPSNRGSEVKRLMDTFGETLRVLQERIGPFEVILPVVSTVRMLIDERLQSWPLRPHLVTGETDKFTAMRLATAALAASGTVTLELSLAGTPMAVAYRVDPIARRLRFLLIAPAVALPNLILGDKIFPELLQEDCTAENLADALAPLMQGGSLRDAQLPALAQVRSEMSIEGDEPSKQAAKIVLDYALSGSLRLAQNRINGH
ncbi:MAG: lipid-A-disaccharide synthase [Methyloceanibacter sp.]|uniref:lipid-A-disaccharide synthase n=1 Tax=Methyloceanibacter sp. TaxID=1965321 RepID=UPI003D9AC157